MSHISIIMKCEPYKVGLRNDDLPDVVGKLSVVCRRSAVQSFKRDAS